MYKIPTDTKNWLLEGEPGYINFLARDFFGLTVDRKELIESPFIQEQFTMLSEWKNEVLKQHNKPGLLIHRLAMLADLGITKQDFKDKSLFDNILCSFNEKNIPELNILIPKSFGGSGEIERIWMICDYPLIIYSLLKMGVDDERINKSISTIIKLSEEDGYHCISALNKFKGPGKRIDICPLANILTARALGQTETGRRSHAYRASCEALLEHWDKRGQKKLFLFGVGTDYKKLKFPFVWYHILTVLQALSNNTEIRNDYRLKEMIEIVCSKADENFRFKPESIYMIYKNEEFSNKKEASRLLTLMIYKLLEKYLVLAKKGVEPQKEEN